MAEKYQFTPVHPPLLKDVDGNIYDVDPASLLRVVGMGTWTKDPSAGGTVTTTYHLTRTWKWVIAIQPKHFAVKEEYDFTYSSSFKQTDRDEITKTLGVDANAKFFGIGASVSASLKITHTEELEWQVSEGTKAHMAFEAGTTYVGWQLLDILPLTGDTATAIPGPPPSVSYGTIPISSMSASIGIYNDAAADADMKLLNNSKESLDQLNSRFDYQLLHAALPNLK